MASSSTTRIAISLQAERERENAPLRERLKVTEDLLADNRTQLKRLLDLYLAGNFPKEMLVESKTRLETTMEALEKERAGLTARPGRADVDRGANTDRHLSIHLSIHLAFYLWSNDHVKQS
jgi:hypothetical protein